MTDGSTAGAGGARTTVDDVVAGADCAGRTALVTGGASGLGEQTARALAAAGATVILSARRAAAADAAAQRIRDAVPGALIDTLVLDLADLGSVASAAERVRGRGGGVDVLVNNAGVMYTPLQRTADGFEMQFGTNHLGHFLLTTMLLPTLRAAAERSGTPARVVSVSSDAHRAYPVDLDDPDFVARNYDKFAAYGRSKSANVLMTVEVESRWGDDGVRAYAVHPGVCATKLARHMDRADFAEMRRLAAARGPGVLDDVKSPAEGAATTVWAATSPALEARGGAYLADCAVGEAEPHARDRQTADALWELSLRRVGGPR